MEKHYNSVYFSDTRHAFEVDVKEILGDELTVKVSKAVLMSEDCFFLDFWHKNVKVTRHNSNAATCIMFTKESDDLFVAERNSLLCQGVKFRKIRAKTAQQLLEKTLKWIKKNSETIIETARQQNIEDQ